MAKHSYAISYPGMLLLVISAVLTVLSVTTTALRFAARFKARKLGWDDYTIIAASALSIGRTIIQLVGVPRGNGHHVHDLALEDYQYINFLTWMTQLFLFPILGLLKTSICLLALRIKDTKGLRISLWITMIGLIITNALPEIILLAECDPVDAYWKSQADKCWTPQVRIYSIYLQTAYSVVTDLLCSLLPIYIVWGLNMNSRKKLGVCGLMSLGLISTAFALLRASSLGIKTDDLSYAYCWAAIWGNIELHLGIIAANLAIIWRLFYRFFKESSFISGGSEDTRNPQPGPGMGGWRHEYQYREPYTPQRATFEGWKTGHSVRVTPLGRRRGSDTASDGSKVPLGITKEVEYTIADARRPSSQGGTMELEGSSAQAYELRDSPRPRVADDEIGSAR